MYIDATGQNDLAFGVNNVLGIRGRLAGRISTMDSPSTTTLAISAPFWVTTVPPQTARLATVTSTSHER